MFERSMFSLALGAINEVDKILETLPNSRQCNSTPFQTDYTHCLINRNI